MNKKIFVVGLWLILIVCVSVGCNNVNRNTGEFDNIATNETKEEKQDDDMKEEKQDNDMKDEKQDNDMKDEKQDDDTKESALGNSKEGDYKNAISDDELDDLLKIITKYYQKKASWEIIDYRIADNTHSFYQLYKEDYELGNIIVFEVHTPHAPDVYRSIVLGRKKDNIKWKVLNEGY